MAGTVTVCHSVTVLLKSAAVLGHQYGAERLVTRLERFLRELDAPAHVTPVGLSQVILVHVHRPFLLPDFPRVRASRVRAARAANSDLLALYWSVGRDILDRQEQAGWGSRVIDRLAADLREEFRAASAPITISRSPHQRESFEGTTRCHFASSGSPAAKCTVSHNRWVPCESGTAPSCSVVVEAAEPGVSAESDDVLGGQPTGLLVPGGEHPAQVASQVAAVGADRLVDRQRNQRHVVRKVRLIEHRRPGTATVLLQQRKRPRYGGRPSRHGLPG